VASSSGWECGDLSGGLTITQVRDALGQTIGDLGCSASQTLLYDGSAWTCAAPVSYQAGAHLALNGNTFSVDTSNLDAASLGGTDASGYLTASEVDSTYLSQADAANDYLALAGGTMSGDLVVQEYVISKDITNVVTTGYRERNTTRLVVENARKRETVAIPADRLHELCHDGCSYTISIVLPGRTDGEIEPRGPFTLSYNQNNGIWRDSFDVHGVAGDGAHNHVFNYRDCCLLTEAEYNAGVGQGDSTVELHLLNNAGSSGCYWGSGSNMQCQMTFND